MNLTRFAAQNLKDEIVNMHRFAAAWHAPKAMRNKAAYRIDLVITIIGAEDWIKLRDFCQCAHSKITGGQLNNMPRVFIKSKFSPILPKNFSNHVFNRHKPRTAPIFTHNDRNM